MAANGVENDCHVEAAKMLDLEARLRELGPDYRISDFVAQSLQRVRGQVAAAVCRSCADLIGGLSSLDRI